MKSTDTCRTNPSQSPDADPKCATDALLVTGACPMCLLAAGMTSPRIRRRLLPLLLLGVAGLVIVSVL